MNNQALRDKLFAALRGDALPHLRELDDIVLADIDRIMPIVEEHYGEPLGVCDFYSTPHPNAGQAGCFNWHPISTKPLINPD